MIYRIFLKLLFIIGIVTSMDIKTEQFKMLDKIKSLFPNNTYNKAHFNRYAKDIKKQLIFSKIQSLMLIKIKLPKDINSQIQL